MIEGDFICDLAQQHPPGKHRGGADDVGLAAVAAERETRRRRRRQAAAVAGVAVAVDAG